MKKTTFFNFFVNHFVELMIFCQVDRGILRKIQFNVFPSPGLHAIEFLRAAGEEQQPHVYYQLKKRQFRNITVGVNQSDR